MLLDFVYDRLKMKKNRQHFNEFMLNFHDFRHEKKDNNTITMFVKTLKKIQFNIFRRIPSYQHCRCNDIG